MTLSKVLIFILAALCSSAPTVRAFDTLKIDATLDTAKKEVYGVVEYHIPATPNLLTFEFQLFPNVYASDSSPYLRGNPQLANHFRQTNRYCNMTIDSLLLDGVNLTSSLKIEYTRGMLPAPEGGTLNDKDVRIFFRTMIPEPGDRLSQLRGNYLLDGWFPNPAVLRPDSTWYNPFYGPFTELVGEYYQYDVTFRTPGSPVIVAPNPAVESIKKDGYTTNRYLFGPAHDFALIVSSDYLVDSLQAGTTTLRFYYRDFEYPALQSLKETCLKTLGYMTDNVGGYQYKYLSYAFVDFAFAGGLEMPAMVSLSSPRGAAMVADFGKLIAIHETVHQWFYGMIGSDQCETPWMDESVSDFFTEKIMDYRRTTPALLFDFGGFKFSDRDYLRTGSEIAAAGLKINSPAYTFVDEIDYFGVIYSRGALALETFENIIGEGAAQIFWRHYYDKYLFKHPNFDDFIQTVAEVAGADYAGVVDALLNDGEETDYSVSSLENRRIDSATYEASFVLRKIGDLDYPVPYRVVLYDGGELDYHWYSPNASDKIYKNYPLPVREVLVDPEGKFAVDCNLMNNSMRYDQDNRPGLRLSSGVVFWIESMLSFLSGI